jgi:hypothetical protein
MKLFKDFFNLVTKHINTKRKGFATGNNQDRYKKTIRKLSLTLNCRKYSASKSKFKTGNVSKAKIQFDSSSLEYDFSNRNLKAGDKGFVKIKIKLFRKVYFVTLPYRCEEDKNGNIRQYLYGYELHKVFKDNLLIRYLLWSNGIYAVRYNEKKGKNKFYLYRVMLVLWEGKRGLLHSDIDVHHINENTLDNRYCNLKPLHKDDHAKLHNGEIELSEVDGTGDNDECDSTNEKQSNDSQKLSKKKNKLRYGTPNDEVTKSRNRCKARQFWDYRRLSTA